MNCFANYIDINLLMKKQTEHADNFPLRNVINFARKMRKGFHKYTS